MTFVEREGYQIEFREINSYFWEQENGSESLALKKEIIVIYAGSFCRSKIIMGLDRSKIFWIWVKKQNDMVKCQCWSFKKKFGPTEGPRIRLQI